MEIKQIPTADFLEFLDWVGVVCIRHESSHYAFDYPDGHEKGKLPKPLIVRTKYKDITLLHMHTNLKTLGLTKTDFQNWQKSRLKGQGKS